MKTAIRSATGILLIPAEGFLALIAGVLVMLAIHRLGVHGYPVLARIDGVIAALGVFWAARCAPAGLRDREASDG